MDSLFKPLHIIDTRDFSREWIENDLFPLTEEMEKRSLIGKLGLPL